MMISGKIVAAAIAAYAVSCIAVHPAGAQEYSDVQDVTALEKKISLSAASKTTISASFVQTKFMSVFSEGVISSGVFFWQSDGKVCLDYRKPVKYAMVISGDRIRTVSNGKSNVVSLKGNPVMSQMRLLTSACMSGNLSALSSGFRMTYQESSDGYKITAVPIDSDLAGYVSMMEIYLDKEDLSVDRLVMHERGSDYTSYSFSDKKFNETIPASVFDMR